MGRGGGYGDGGVKVNDGDMYGGGEEILGFSEGKCWEDEGVAEE